MNDEQKQKARDRAKAYRLAHLDEIRAKDRERAAAFRASNPELSRKRKLAWSAAHPEYLVDYCVENAETARERTRQWKKDNPDRVKVNNQRRRAFKKNAGGSITYEQWIAQCEKQRWKCYDCGRDDVKLTMGHGVPLYAGGTHDPSNIIAQCGRCNSKQGKRIHPEFLGENHGYA